MVKSLTEGSGKGPEPGVVVPSDRVTQDGRTVMAFAVDMSRLGSPVVSLTRLRSFRFALPPASPSKGALTPAQPATSR